MKKVLFTTLSIIAAAAMVLVSCKKEPTEKPDDNKKPETPTEEVDPELVGTWTIIGEYQGWGEDVAMTESNNVWTATNVPVKGEGFKFRKDGKWDINLGAVETRATLTYDDGAEILLEKNADNIAGSKGDGYYDVTLNLLKKTATIKFVKDLEPEVQAITAATWAEVETAEGVNFFQYWTTGDWGNPTVPVTEADSFDNLTVENGVYTVDYSTGAPELWMAQLFIRPNPKKATLPLVADKKYHVAITIKSSAAMTPWVKFTKYEAEPQRDPNWNDSQYNEACLKHEGACIWECGNVALEADTPHTFEFVASGVECDNVNWTMGLGGHNGATITISDIKVEELTYTDLSTVNALAADADFDLTAIVAASFKISDYNSAAIVTDGTNCFYLFFNPATNNTLEAGDIVNAKGKISIYNKLIESVKNPEVTVLAKGVTVPELTPVAIESFDTFLSKNEPTGLYVASGKYVVDGKYTNLVIDGSTAKGSLSGEIDANLNGKNVTVTGWFTGADKNSSFAYLRATKIEKLPVKISIDGDMSEWDEVDEFTSSATSRIRKWKYASDADNHYFYFALRKNRADSGRKLVIGFNTDKDENTGSLNDGNAMKGCEAIVKGIVPFTNASGASELTFLAGTASGTATSTAGATTENAATCWGYDAGEDMSAEASNAYVEISIPKTALALPAGEIQIGASYDYYFSGYTTVTLN